MKRKSNKCYAESKDEYLNVNGTENMKNAFYLINM
jgi:hypothetical protein